MVQSFIENIAATVIFTAAAALAKRLWDSIKKALSSPAPSTAGAYSKKVVHHQFFISLAVLVLCLPAAVLSSFIPHDWLPFLRMVLFSVSGFAIIFAWGAFEAAFAFYPDTEPRQDKPPKDDSNNTARKDPK